ncbi:hypothetical protein OG478_13670 [Streptomyces phaeochromogenes]|uniref:hypothetical protein n=1 Tax=Streptomyces phaeochromogenes TaxID=1923 RepID=UPI003864DD95|nr:hypothetical protein OG478_13670 [Streptomyces phaeochromogenes]
MSNVLAQGARRGPAPRPDVAFTPVINGMDYLESVFEHLTRGKIPSARDLKYAVLHLQAATEVLLKARLKAEHFSLLFSHPGKATREKFERGDFQSCTTLEAVDRLRDIAQLAISKDDRERIEELGKTRNALQHYGLTLSAAAVEARAVGVLDFLITFIGRHLLPGLPSDEASRATDTMVSLAPRLGSVQALVTQRLTRLSDTLDRVVDVTVKCPDCKMWALVADGTAAGPGCLFCERAWESPHSAAVDYAFIMTELVPVPDSPGTWTTVVIDCLRCGESALVPEAVTIAPLPGPTPLCFACGTVFGYLADCGGCGKTLDSGPTPDKFPLCDPCFRVKHAGEDIL